MSDATNKTTEKARAVLRDVIRSGGKDDWSHLHDMGHHWATVASCAKRGLLYSHIPYHFEITDKGLEAINGTR